MKPVALWTACVFACYEGGNAAAPLDLSRASIVALPESAKPVRSALRMLSEEVAQRTQVRWPINDEFSASGPSIVVGTLDEVKRLARPGLSGLPAEVGLGRSEGYSIWVEDATHAPRVFVVGQDSRAVLYGVGRLLRELHMERQRVSLAAGITINTAPRMRLRGHQLGFRPKTNSYDGWDVPTWEQYLRDLVVFGCNAIELIPPRSDDLADSPHFPLPQMEMMIEMSRLADDYGLEVWVWYPALDQDYSDSRAVEFALREWGDVFRKLPRVDAVFVPGGDPGHTRPKHLFALLEQQTANLRRLHPAAGMWVSPQGFTAEWLEEFYELLRAEPAWLAGIVHGPQVRVSHSELRARVPGRYPIRDYPDITHSRHCQYPVPDWDLAFALTEGREIINPRPTQMANIFRVTTLPHTLGFITYSEGCNDDVNKAVWSALGWDPDADVREVLRHYSRYFIGSGREREFAEGLLALEQSWNGAVLTNTAIESTLDQFRALERGATPQEKLNWRFQQALYRAYYDAYVRRRLTHETDLELAALEVLNRGGDSGARMQAAERLLDRANDLPVAPELRARIFELAEALFQSIHMQLSVERYGGMPGRGSNLDELDAPLNNRLWLKQRFAQIRSMPDEPARRAALSEIARWQDPGPGGHYDDLGDPRKQPHLVMGEGWRTDPGFYRTPQVGFTDLKSAGGEAIPISWWRSAEAIYDQTLRMRYPQLDPQATYVVEVVYGRYRNNAPVRLTADGLQELHPHLLRVGERLRFPVPREATADGELELTWWPSRGLGGNGRVLDVAEVWLRNVSERSP